MPLESLIFSSEENETVIPGGSCSPKVSTVDHSEIGLPHLPSCQMKHLTAVGYSASYSISFYQLSDYH